MPRPLRPPFRLACCAALALLALGARAQPSAEPFAEASAQASALSGGLVINEVMYAPPSGQPTSNEWVEVLNGSALAVDLSEVSLTTGGTPARLATAPTSLAPGAFVVLVRNAAAFAEAYPGVPFVAVARFPTLRNTGDRVALVRGDTEIDAVPYLPAWGGAGASLERRYPTAPGDDRAGWCTSSDPARGTPGRANSCFALDTTPPALLDAEALDAFVVEASFSERVTPETSGRAEAYQLDPGALSPLVAEPGADGRRVRLVWAEPLRGPATYTLTARGLADPAGNVLAEGQVSFAFGRGDVPARGDLVVNEFLYAEPSAESPREWVELYNRSDKTFDLADFTLGDDTGRDEPVTPIRTLIAPGGYAVVARSAEAFRRVFPGVAVVEPARWNALNDGGDAVALRYGGVLVDSLRYAPSWGGASVSLERLDPAGPSDWAGNWATTRDPRGGTPGTQNTRYAPDREGPRLVRAEAGADERSVRLWADEPLDPLSVRAAGFELLGYAITEALLEGDPALVTLRLDRRLAAGPHLVSAQRLRDRLGNETALAALAFQLVPDLTPPRLLGALAPEASTIEAWFSKPLGPGSLRPDAFRLHAHEASPGVSSEGWAFREAEAVPGRPERVRLRLAAPLPEGRLYRLEVREASDLAGNTLAFASAALYVGTPEVPRPGEIVLTEIMYDPAGGSEGEYVEIYNRTPDRTFDLRAVRLDKGTPGTATLTDAPAWLGPGEYAAVVRSGAAFSQAFPEASFVAGKAFPALGNGGDLVVLRAGGLVLDSVRYAPRMHRPELRSARGVALERRDVAGLGAGAWTSSLDPSGGTPGRANSVSVRSGEAPSAAGLQIHSPFDPDGGEASAIRYTLRAEAGLVRARLFDGAGRLVRELEAGRLGGREGALVWDGRDAGGRTVRVGPYVVLLESVDVAAGTTEAYRGVVVVGRR